LHETGLQMGHAVTQGRDRTMLGLHGARCTVHAHTWSRLRLFDISCACFYATHKYTSAHCVAVVPNFIQNGH